jgi:hypothetical protein
MPNNPPRPKRTCINCSHDKVQHRVSGSCSVGACLCEGFVPEAASPRPAEPQPFEHLERKPKRP